MATLYSTLKDMVTVARYADGASDDEILVNLIVNRLEEKLQHELQEMVDDTIAEVTTIYNNVKNQLHKG